MNIVVLPDIWKANKEVARRNPGLIIEGVIEFRDGVTNLVARDRSSRFETGSVEK